MNIMNVHGTFRYLEEPVVSRLETTRTFLEYARNRLYIGSFRTVRERFVLNKVLVLSRVRPFIGICTC
jgi:hypothetical protein